MPRNKSCNIFGSVFWLSKGRSNFVNYSNNLVDDESNECVARGFVAHILGFSEIAVVVKVNAEGSYVIMSWTTVLTPYMLFLVVRQIYYPMSALAAPYPKTEIPVK